MAVSNMLNTWRCRYSERSSCLNFGHIRDVYGQASVTCHFKAVCCIKPERKTTPKHCGSKAQLPSLITSSGHPLCCRRSPRPCLCFWYKSLLTCNLSLTQCSHLTICLITGRPKAARLYGLETHVFAPVHAMLPFRGQKKHLLQLVLDPSRDEALFGGHTWECTDLPAVDILDYIR